jgi:hypothetical protein
MEIRCKKEDCKHNTGCSCAAGVVAINRGSHCESYTNDPLKNEIIKENGNIFKVADEIAPTHIRNVPLECGAKSCLFNKDAACRADGITIISADDGASRCGGCCNADCVTFCGN